ncbi:MAG TPA: hypothetical protein VMR76_02090 [Candidatus Saccharimonadia bacterium]|nr:hypothetical protein [Candidatus Saccharimonadia bacterium]
MKTFEYVDPELELFRRHALDTLIEDVGVPGIGDFLSQAFKGLKVGDEEYDIATVRYLVDLLPEHTEVRVFPAEGSTLKLDCWPDDEPPGSVEVSDPNKPAISTQLEYFRYVDVVRGITVFDVNTVRVSGPGESILLTFDDKGNPNFRLEVLLPTPSTTQQ